MRDPEIRRHLRHLNYNHLLYAWTVAREGSVTAASSVLHLTPQTISGQIKQLEGVVGAPLFLRAGRGLTLSDAGRSIMPYLDEIFSLGAELAQRVHNDEGGLPSSMNVGIVNTIPKLIAYRTLAPILERDAAPRLMCYEGELEHLLAELAVHRLDLLLSDRPVPTGLSVKAYSHKLGESNMAFFARGKLAQQCSANFPDSLDKVPMLLPVASSAIRRGLDDWFNSMGIVPRVIAEFDDSALMKAFGESGVAVFPAPEAIRKEVENMYGASWIGAAEGVGEAFYAISPERKLSNPVVVEITELARLRLGGQNP